jgi:hypothetical protein
MSQSIGAHASQQVSQTQNKSHLNNFSTTQSSFQNQPGNTKNTQGGSANNFTSQTNGGSSTLKTQSNYSSQNQNLNGGGQYNNANQNMQIINNMMNQSSSLGLNIA